MRKDTFFDYLIFEKRFSSHTITAYRKDLDQFSSFIEERYAVVNDEEITHHFVRDWIVDLLSNQELSASSVNRKISTLKSYFKFLIKQKVLSKNPMLKIVSPKKPGVLPGFVDVKAMDELFTEDLFDDSFNGVRDHLIILLFYQTGMRLSELIGITLKDVDFGQHEVKVLGKRNKQRIIPLTFEVESLIRKYLDYRVEYDTSNNESLFITEKGKTIYPGLVYKTVNFYLGQVTTLKKKSPHVLRHTFATHMLNNGADLNVIKEILGHSSLAATQVYTHNSFEKIKSIYNMAHPRA